MYIHINIPTSVALCVVGTPTEPMHKSSRNTNLLNRVREDNWKGTKGCRKKESP